MRPSSIVTHSSKWVCWPSSEQCQGVDNNKQLPHLQLIILLPFNFNLGKRLAGIHDDFQIGLRNLHSGRGHEKTDSAWTSSLSETFLSRIQVVEVCLPVPECHWVGSANWCEAGSTYLGIFLAITYNCNNQGTEEKLLWIHLSNPFPMYHSFFSSGSWPNPRHFIRLLIYIVYASWSKISHSWFCNFPILGF